MKLDDVLEEWIKDSVIDETELSKESLNVPILHGKYLKLFSNAKLKLRRLEYQRKELQNTLSEYYSGELNNPEDLDQIGREPWRKKLVKAQIADYVMVDKDIIDINLKIVYCEEVTETLKEIIKSINNRTFIIKNSIEFLKFQNGGY